MSEIGNTSKSLGQQGQTAANKAADVAKDGMRNVQKATDQVIDKASDKADDLRNQAVPFLDKVSDQSQKLLQQGRESLHDTTQLVKEKAMQASDLATGYTKDEPMKAMLIAAAAGALLMGLIAVLGRSRN